MLYVLHLPVDLTAALFAVRIPRTLLPTNKPFYNQDYQEYWDLLFLGFEEDRAGDIWIQES